MPDTHETREKHLKPEAAPGQDEAGEILRGRPVQEKIDHRSLTREIIARFPKILAALAK